MTATIPLCPECGHPVDKHDSFFCEAIGCRCNNSKKTAMALYERDCYKNLYEEAQKTLDKYVNPELIVQESD